MSSFKSTENIQKKEGGSDRSEQNVISSFKKAFNPDFDINQNGWGPKRKSVQNI